MQKQIEKDLTEIFDEEYEKRRLITPQFTAERLIEKGYRKQSEGEWIVHPLTYECSVCREELCVEEGKLAEDYDPVTDWELYYCPYCGAKMKGAENAESN